MEKKSATIYMPRFQKTCRPRGWTIRGDQYVGSGISGDVYRACLGKDCDYVAKIMHIMPENLADLYEEAKLMRELGEKNLAPRFQTGIVCDNVKDLEKVFVDAKEFVTNKQIREENQRHTIEWSRNSFDKELGVYLKRLQSSPLYGVIFSRYVPSSLELVNNKNDQKQQIAEAVRKLVDQFEDLYFDADYVGTGGNVRVYRNPISGKWTAKLIDVGHSSFAPTSPKRTSYQREKLVEDILHEMFDSV